MEGLIHFAGIIVVAAPVLMVAGLTLPPLVGWSFSERAINRLTYCSVGAGLLACLVVLGAMLAGGSRNSGLDLGHWISLEEQHFHFHVKFIFDRLSVPLAILTYLLCGTVGAFTSRYLHREPGYLRFYIAFSLFMTGMIAATLSGTIEVLFLGWELVGLSSALLIAFFHERRAPLRNGLRAWVVYRIADAAFVAAAVLMHHLSGEGDFAVLMGSGDWPEGVSRLTANQSMAVGFLLIIAAAGKSGLVPFSGWLPRAMEGPTSSSAVFYGALSVHLGAFLLLRISPILELSPWLSGTVVALGLLTALHATMCGRVQADIKTALAYASLTQVGIIVAEIGFGLRYVALIHILGHAALRTLQLLRAPTLLHDYHNLENALGGHLPEADSLWGRLVPQPVRVRLYGQAIGRWQLDGWLDQLVVRPFRLALGGLDRAERRWAEWLEGPSSAANGRPPLHPEVIEELRL